MSLVSWIGNPDHWTPPDVPVGEAHWVLAADEESLPDVAQHLNGRHISVTSALKAADRHLLRRCLSAKFNPDWACFSYHRHIAVKAPASSGSSGVRLLNLETPEIEIVRRLWRVSGGSEELFGVVEEFIEGDAIELSGVKLNGRVFFFHPLRQYWSPDLRRIERYERVIDYWWLYGETVGALSDIKFDNSAFCVEWRVVDHETAKVIEINPRPGDDDKGYFDLLWDIPIAEQIERWAQEVYRAESPETVQAMAPATNG